MSLIFWRPCPAVLLAYYSLCTHSTLLEGLGGPYVMPEIKFALATCKASGLPTVLSLWVQFTVIFKLIMYICMGWKKYIFFSIKQFWTMLNLGAPKQCSGKLGFIISNFVPTRQGGSMRPLDHESCFVPEMSGITSNITPRL